MDAGISEPVVYQLTQLQDSVLAEVTTGKAPIAHFNQQDF
jgi:hypothetical protein